MIKEYIVSRPGKYHHFKQESNQDKFCVIRDNALLTVVLCDGAGFSEYGGDAATLVAKTFANFMHENFQRILFGNVADIKREACKLIDIALYKFSESEQIKITDLATTIMAVTLHENGSFIGFHLGDGQMDYKIDNRWLRLSSPENGEHKNETQLTGNCSLYQNLRFYKWNDIKYPTDCIQLKTDGMDQFTIEEQDAIISTDGKELRNNWDDCSFAQIIRDDI